MAEPSAGSESSPGPSDLPSHPIGTFAFVGLYALLFVAGWVGIYLWIYLARHPVTP